MVGSDLSFFSLILGASLPVQMVMVILIFASGMSWKYIYLKIKVLKSTEKNTDEFEKFFWSGGDLGKLYEYLTSPTTSAETAWCSINNRLVPLTSLVSIEGLLLAPIISSLIESSCAGSIVITCLVLDIMVSENAFATLLESV